MPLPLIGCTKFIEYKGEGGNLGYSNGLVRSRDGAAFRKVSKIVKVKHRDSSAELRPLSPI